MEASPSTTPRTARPFGPIHTVEPRSRHTHTAILLHGRGSTGDEFAEELLDSKLSDQTSLFDALPGWRWVFPSSRELWSTVFEEYMPAWFEAHSLTDVNARQDLQMPGIKDSTEYLQPILQQEMASLGGRSDRLILGGISQGAAMGIWTLLCLEQPSSSVRRLGAFVGASTWLPFAATIQHQFGARPKTSHSDGDGGPSVPAVDDDDDDANEFVRNMMTPLLLRAAGTQAHGSESSSLLATPVFIGHGTDDAYVDVALGQQARDVLTQVGFNVEWREYQGAEQEGHWLKTPEQVDDIADFLARLTT